MNIKNETTGFVRPWKEHMKISILIMGCGSPVWTESSRDRYYWFLLDANCTRKYVGHLCENWLIVSCLVYPTLLHISGCSLASNHELVAYTRGGHFPTASLTPKPKTHEWSWTWQSHVSVASRPHALMRLCRAVSMPWRDPFISLASTRDTWSRKTSWGPQAMTPNLLEISATELFPV